MVKKSLFFMLILVVPALAAPSPTSHTFHGWFYSDQDTESNASEINFQANLRIDTSQIDTVDLDALNGENVSVTGYFYTNTTNESIFKVVGVHVHTDSSEGYNTAEADDEDNFEVIETSKTEIDE